MLIQATTMKVTLLALLLEIPISVSVNLLVIVHKCAKPTLDAYISLVGVKIRSRESALWQEWGAE